MRTRRAYENGVATAPKGKVHTHYDNLRISRNAPAEVVRAAYRALSQKYHPDKNRRPDAVRIMAILNASYAVLSDETLRRRHDAWIEAQEAGVMPDPPSSAEAPAAAFGNDRPMPDPPPRQAYAQAYATHAEAVGELPGEWQAGAPSYLVMLLGGSLILAFAILLLMHERSMLHPLPLLSAALKAAHAEAADDDAAAYAPVNVIVLPPPPKIRIPLGPDGRPWPLGPKVYADGGLPGGGRAALTIDNSRNPHPVYVKIRSAAGPGVSELFIPRHRLYAMDDLPAGIYLLKYRDLQTGDAMESGALLLPEVTAEAADRYQPLRVVLSATNAAADPGFHFISASRF